MPSLRYGDEKVKVHFSDIFKSHRTLLAEEIAYQALKRERARERADKEAAEKAATEKEAAGKGAAESRAPTSSPKTKPAKGSSPSGKLVAPVWGAEQDALLMALKNLNKSWKEISTVMDNKPIPELKRRWAQKRSATAEAEMGQSTEEGFKAAVEAGIKAAIDAEKKAEGEKVSETEADIKAVIEARVKAAIEAERKAEAEKAEAQRKAAAEAGREASIEAEIRAVVEARVKAALEAEKKAAAEKANQGNETGNGRAEEDGKREQDSKLQEKRTRRVSFSNPLIIPGKTDQAAAVPRGRGAKEPKNMYYFETKFTLDEIILLHKLEARYEKEKWLQIASRFFDKTGKRITPQQAKSRFENKTQSPEMSV